MRCALIFSFLAGIAVTALATKPPRWSDNYITNGTLYIPYAEIAEPFSAWYDQTTKRSRIDYYYGMVKTYQLTNKLPYGTSVKLVPVSNTADISEITCLRQDGFPGYPVQIQSVLPNTENFQLVGTETLMGFNCDKFRLEETIEQKKNVYTLWVRYKKSPCGLIPIPVRYEMRGFNTLLGSHYDHYYLDYDSYNAGEIRNEVFELDKSTGCSNSFGSGEIHLATFNPMQEFIYPTVDHHVEHAFNQFKSKHGIDYRNEEQHEYRKNIFRQNLRFINSKNREKSGYTLAINHLADKTDDELRARRGYKSSGVHNTAKPFPYNVENLSADIPDQYDWRLYGAVTPVKDQSICGSCWSFGTIGQVEGAFFLKNGGNLVRLSQQALIDCSWQYGNNGCDGGEDVNSYQWIMQMGGVPTEEGYGPYLGQDGYCHVKNVSLVAPITGYVNVNSNDPQAFKIALLKHGPLSVAIDASHKTFSFYSHGVYYEPNCSSDQLDHAVLAVGYGNINGEDYWLIKNSWSTYWGDDGYILMSARNNNCGVMTVPTYVEM